jgi:hypothetical protein
MPIAGSIYEFTNVGTVSGATTINSVSLEVEPTNAVGSLKIGSINIGLQKKPNIAQRVLHRLLGFSWKDK